MLETHVTQLNLYENIIDIYIMSYLGPRALQAV